MNTLYEQMQEERQRLLQDAEVIENATFYNANGLHTVSAIGRGIDTSERCSQRLDWIRKAEDHFIEMHHREIMDLAAAWIRDKARIKPLENHYDEQ